MPNAASTATVAPLILIVDDVPEDRATLRRYLTRDIQPPYRLLEAHNIARALELAASERPDCVLLDFNLTDGDGLSLLRRLVNTYTNNAFGLIMLTGSGEASVAVEAMKTGAHDYVEKNNLTSGGLRRAVANSIDKASIQRQLAMQARELALKNEALQKTATQLRTVTDHLPISIAQFDRLYCYRFANQHFTARFGLTPESIVGKHLVEVVGEKVAAEYKPKMEQALAGQQVDFETPVRYRGKDFWYRVTYIPERNAAGDVIGFVAVSNDITDRKRAESEMARARDEAIDATRARDNFLAALSHELRTPLNPVLLVASEAADNPSLPPAVRDDFTSIRDHVELEARLIDDLLDLSRISHGKLKLEQRRLGLHGVLQNAIATVKPDIDAKEIVFRVAFAPQEPFVHADAVRLQQVFWNVLKNAVKFTPAGGNVTLESAVDADRRVACVRITDSGIGMSANELPRIFDAFSQGDHAQSAGLHRFGGLGLGLAITRMLVEAHAGKIVAESAGANQGSTFTIELPLAHGAILPAPAATPALTPALQGNGHGARPRLGTDDDEADEKAAVAAGSSAGRPSRGRIFLIEDHAPTRASLGAVLGRRGFQVTAAATMAEALDLAKKHEIDLVISDIGLPDGDGYACMRLLQEMRPGIRGIALSGYGMEEDLAKSRQVGFIEHLIKPVNVNALDRAVTRALNHESGEGVSAGNS